MSKFSQYTAINKWALVFPTDVFLVLVEKHDPHGPEVKDLEKLFEKMAPEDKKITVALATSLAKASKMVLEAAAAKTK
ncbi:hypothetical protein EPN96_03415 [bacterium]|nr:MAG: hypothetical protein EPN96_03415 [bacterium]